MVLVPCVMRILRCDAALQTLTSAAMSEENHQQNNAKITTHSVGPSPNRAPSKSIRVSLRVDYG